MSTEDSEPTAETEVYSGTLRAKAQSKEQTH
jgi:hypothetical protein